MEEHYDATCAEVPADRGLCFAHIIKDIETFETKKPYADELNAGDAVVTFLRILNPDALTAFLDFKANKAFLYVHEEVYGSGRNSLLIARSESKVTVASFHNDIWKNWEKMTEYWVSTVGAWTPIRANYVLMRVWVPDDVDYVGNLLAKDIINDFLKVKQPLVNTDFSTDFKATEDLLREFR